MDGDGGEEAAASALHEAVSRLMACGLLSDTLTVSRVDYKFSLAQLVLLAEGAATPNELFMRCERISPEALHWLEIGAPCQAVTWARKPCQKTVPVRHRLAAAKDQRPRVCTHHSEEWNNFMREEAILKASMEPNGRLPITVADDDPDDPTDLAPSITEVLRTRSDWIPWLTERQADVALNICAQFDRFGDLSDRQVDLLQDLYVWGTRRAHVSRFSDSCPGSGQNVSEDLP